MFRSAARFSIASALALTGCFSGTPQAPNDILIDGGPDAGDAGGVLAVDGGCPTGDGGFNSDGGLAQGVVLTDCSGVCFDLSSDESNCGSCGNACSGCTNGFCANVVSPSEPGVGAITSNDTDVYWVDSDAGSIVQFPLSRGGTPTTIATGQANPVAIAVDSTTALYWANAPSGHLDGAIMKLTLGGGGGAPITLASGLPNATDIAVGSNDIYWTQATPEGIFAISKNAAGGAASTIVSTGAGTTPHGIAVNPGSSTTSVYWTDQARGNILKAAATGGTVSTIATGQSTPWSLTADSANLYWTNEGNGSVMKLGLSASGSPVTISAGSRGGEAVGIAINPNGTSVFWTDVGAKAVLRAPVSGGMVTTIAGDLTNAAGITVQSEGEFVTDQTTGEVIEISPTNN